jgi:hypothetical protein
VEQPQAHGPRHRQARARRETSLSFEDNSSAQASIKMRILATSRNAVRLARRWQRECPSVSSAPRATRLGYATSYVVPREITWYCSSESVTFHVWILLQPMNDLQSHEHTRATSQASTFRRTPHITESCHEVLATLVMYCNLGFFFNRFSEFWPHPSVVCGVGNIIRAFKSECRTGHIAGK